jgi:hypothetical protein
VIRYVCVSDLHLGAPNSLLSEVRPGGDDVDVSRPSDVLVAVAACLHHLVERVNGVDGPRPTLLLNGDVLELALADDDEAIGTFGRFAAQMGGCERWDRIVYLPGNHDHHLWETTREQAYAEQVARSSIDAALPDPIHATAVMDDVASDGTPFRSSLLTAVLESVLDDAPDLDVRYPLLGLRSDLSDRTVMVHHGHFVEPVYQLMSAIRLTGFPGGEPPRTMADIEAENFAWIDYFWSTLGRSARVGRDVAFVYNMVQDPEAARALVENFARPLAAKLPWWVPFRERTLRWGFGAAADHVLSLERLSAQDPDRADDGDRLRDLLAGPLAAQYEVSAASPHREPVTFLYGHTHMPLGVPVSVGPFAHPVVVHNTGGWVVDEVTPQVGLGGAAVLLDEELRAVRVELFRQLPGDEVCGPVVRGCSDAGTFLDEVRTALDLDGPPWRDLQPLVATTMESRRRMVERAIRRGVEQAKRRPRRR